MAVRGRAIHKNRNPILYLYSFLSLSIYFS